MALVAGLTVSSACGDDQAGGGADAGGNDDPMFWTASPDCSSAGGALTCPGGIEIQTMLTPAPEQILAGTTNWNYRDPTLTDSPAQLLRFDGFGDGPQQPASWLNLPGPEVAAAGLPVCSGFSQLTDIAVASYSGGGLSGSYTVVSTGASAYIEASTLTDHSTCGAHGNVFLVAPDGEITTTGLEHALASYYTQQTSEARYVLPYDSGALGCTASTPCLFAFAAAQSLPPGSPSETQPASVWRARVGVTSCASSFFAGGVCWDAAPIFEFGTTPVRQMAGGVESMTTSFFASRMKSGGVVDRDGNVYFGSAGSVADGEAAVYMLRASDDSVWLFHRDATAAQIRGFLFDDASNTLLVLNNPSYVADDNIVLYFDLGASVELPRAPTLERVVGLYSYGLSRFSTNCGDFIAAPAQEIVTGGTSSAGFYFVSADTPTAQWSPFAVDIPDVMQTQGFDRAIRTVVGASDRADVLVAGFDAYVDFGRHPPDGSRDAYPSDTAFIRRVDFCGAQ